MHYFLPELDCTCLPFCIQLFLQARGSSFFLMLVSHAFMAIITYAYDAALIPAGCVFDLLWFVLVAPFFATLCSGLRQLLVRLCCATNESMFNMAPMLICL